MNHYARFTCPQCGGDIKVFLCEEPWAEEEEEVVYDGDLGVPIEFWDLLPTYVQCYCGIDHKIVVPSEIKVFLF